MVVAPAGTGLLPVNVLTIARSASSCTTTSAVSVLLAKIGSGVRPLTLARLMSVAGPAEGDTLATTVIVGSDPWLATPAGWMQVTTWSTRVHGFHPAPEADRKVVPAGRTSVTVVGPTELDGPLFVTVRDHVAFPPARTVCVSGVLEMARSAEEVKSVRSVLALLARFGSRVLPVTVAVLTKAPVAGAPVATAIPIRTARVWPTPSPPARVQVTVWRAGAVGAVAGFATHVQDPVMSTFVPV